MSKLNTQKNEDWHRADIVCELHKAGWSIRKLSTHHGYSSPTTLCRALDRAWPKGERIIANAIGIDPAEIWPSRYLRKDTIHRAKGHRTSGKETPA